jgi:predicted permease
MIEIRDAIRSLLRARWFTLGAVLTFTIGIGANVAVLSMVDRMLFRPVPFPDPDRLVHVHRFAVGSGADRRLVLDTAISTRWAMQSRLLDGLAFADARATPEVMAGFGDAPVYSARASYNLFDVLRVQPLLGRSFSRDDVVNQSFVLMLSYGAWQTRFGGVRDVVGRRVGSGRWTYEIVGVLPRGFFLPTSTHLERLDVLILDFLQTFDKPGSERTIQGAPVARLKAGVSIDAASAELAAVIARAAPELPWVQKTMADGRVPQVLPLRTGMFLAYRPHLQLIVAAVAILLAIACVNLSTLFLARGRSRDRDAAIRAALGARGTRLVCTVFIECLVVCAASCAAAIAAFALARQTILAVIPQQLRTYALDAFDIRLLLIAAGVAIGAALLSAVVPASRLWRLDPVAVLQRRSTAAASSKSAWWLLVVQTAFGVVLVIGATMTVRNLVQLLLDDPGYRADGLHLAHVQHGYDIDRAGDPLKDARKGMPPVSGARYRALMSTLGDEPGVERFGITTGLELVGRGAARNDFWAQYGTPEAGVWGIGPGVFETLETPLLAGRAVRDEDVTTLAPVAMLNERAVQQIWPGVTLAEAIGRQLPTPAGPRQVIGVVADMRPYPGTRANPALFVPICDPLASRSESAVNVVIRMSAGRQLDATALDRSLDTAIERDNTSVRALSESLDPFLRQPRFQATLFGLFALCAVALIVVGLYATASYDVTRRRFEMGVRVSLGATAAHLRRAVIRSSCYPVITGAVAGLIGAWWAARFLQAFLFEVDARDPWTYSVALGVFAVTTVVAVWVPAGRAARTDPVSVLKSY